MFKYPTASFPTRSPSQRSRLQALTTTTGENTTLPTENTPPLQLQYVRGTPSSPFVFDLVSRKDLPMANPRVSRCTLGELALSIHMSSNVIRCACSLIAMQCTIYFLAWYIFPYCINSLLHAIHSHFLFSHAQRVSPHIIRVLVNEPQEITVPRNLAAGTMNQRSISTRYHWPDLACF